MRVHGCGFDTPIPASARPDGSEFLPISRPVGFFFQPNPPHLKRVPVGFAGFGYPLLSVGERLVGGVPRIGSQGTIMVVVSDEMPLL